MIMSTSRLSQEKTGTAHALISRTCVNNCVFCAVATKKKKRQFPEKEEIIQFIKKCAGSGISNMIFSGLGEPTLDINFDEYLKIAGNLGFNKICLFTNGYGLTAEKAQKWKDRGLSEVLLSIHGLEKGHDKNVQRIGSFKEAVNALDIYTRSNYSVSVNTCLTRFNMKEIPELKQLLSRYMIKIHTLSFPEWDGNTNLYTDHLITYEEVYAVADKLIEHDDEVTLFDNIPYCLVKRNIREMRGLSPIQYLDGKGEMELAPNNQKIYPEICTENKCQLLKICPGFESNYITVRGWGGIKEKVNKFLAEHAKNSTTYGGNECQDMPTTVTSSPTNIREEKYLHKHSLTLVVKPTNRCNAACIYCSSFKADSYNDMSEKLLETMYHNIFKYTKHAKIRHINILWHGGEPLLMGKEFYLKAWQATLDKKEFAIKHMIQTNLISVDKEWIELFKRYDVNVSTSVDPVDKSRVYKDGRLQYPDWLENFVLLCESGLSTGIVFTATSNHLTRVNDIYNFFKNIQTLSTGEIGIKINPVYPSGKAELKNGNSLSISPADYGVFLASLYELWDKDGRQFPVSPLNEWSGRRQAICENSGDCFNHFLSIDGEGNIFNCGRFLDSGIPLGNIYNQKLSHILTNSPWRLNLFKRQEMLHNGHCSGCELWKYCKGGCPYFSELYYSDSLQASPFCETTKIFFERTILNSLQTSGETIK